jgi:SOS-response transcriptional repressor LexA
MKAGAFLKEAGIAPSTGTYSFPNDTWSGENMEKIAKRYGVTIDWLKSGREADNKIISSPKNNSAREVMIYESVAAGIPIGRWENKNDPEEVITLSHPRLNRIREKLYGFIVYGDSMKDRFRNGDTVIATYIDLNAGSLPKDRDIVATFFNSDPETCEATIKLFQWADKGKTSFILKSINPYYPDGHYTFKDVRKMFRVHLNISFVDYRDNK